MSLKRSPGVTPQNWWGFSVKNRGVTPSVAAPGDTNPRDATVILDYTNTVLILDFACWLDFTLKLYSANERTVSEQSLSLEPLLHGWTSMDTHASLPSLSTTGMWHVVRGYSRKVKCADDVTLSAWAWEMQREPSGRGWTGLLQRSHFTRRHRRSRGSSAAINRNGDDASRGRYNKSYALDWRLEEAVQSSTVWRSQNLYDSLF